MPICVSFSAETMLVSAMKFPLSYLGSSPLPCSPVLQIQSLAFLHDFLCPSSLTDARDRTEAKSATHPPKKKMIQNGAAIRGRREEMPTSPFFVRRAVAALRSPRSLLRSHIARGWSALVSPARRRMASRLAV